MSDGDRGKRAQDLVAAGLCTVALLAAVILAFAIGNASGVNGGREQVSAREHYEHTKQDNLRACIGREGAAAVECVSEAIEAAQQQSDSRQDLYAQRDMSRWAFWLLILTAITVAITAVGVWFVKRTLEATLEAVEDTGKATEAMQDANKIAREAQRPWLSVRAHLSSSFEPGQTHEGVDGFYVNVAGEIKNHGDSPATDIHIIVEIRLPPAGVEWEKAMHAYCDIWREKAFAGGPARFAGQGMPFEHLAFIPQAEIDRALAECGDFKMISPLLFGCVSYRTSKVPGVRQTRFMYHIAAIENGKAKVIRADNPDWWRGDIQVTNIETVAAD
jgi:hypothetical protein